MKFWTGLLAVGCLAASLLAAPPAPIPEQIGKAKRIFLANGGNESYRFTTLGDGKGGDNDRLYNQVYASLKEWGRFELVSNPGQADLIFEIHVADRCVPSLGEETCGFRVLLSLAIIDSGRGAPLWILSQYSGYNLLEGTFRKNFDAAALKLIEDLKQVAARSEASDSKHGV
jgi:hypothetical protein